MKKSLNILLTSAGRRAYLAEWFHTALQAEIRAGSLGEGGVWCGNSSSFGAALYAAGTAGTWLSPPIADPAYVPALFDFCRAHRIDAVVPLLDPDVLALSAPEVRRSFSAADIRLLVPENRTALRCSDKLTMFRYLRSHGVGVPVTWTVQSLRLRHLRCGLPFPLIVKPRWGFGSRQTCTVQDMEELAAAVKHEADLPAGTAGELIFQPGIIGREYNLDIISDLEGRYRTTIIKEKQLMRSGETDAAELVWNSSPEGQRLQQLGRRLGELLPHPGDLDCDVILTSEGLPYVLDLNARFGGGYPFAHAAGVDLPRAIVRWLLQEPVPGTMLEAVPGICGMKAPMVVTTVRGKRNQAIALETPETRAASAGETPSRKRNRTADPADPVSKTAFHLIQITDHDAAIQLLEELGECLTPPLSARKERTARTLCDKLMSRGRLTAAEDRTSRRIGAFGFYCNGLCTAGGGADAWGTFFAVAPDWRRRGVGAALFASVRAQAAAAGMNRFCLLTHGGNRAALRFYRQQGCTIECCSTEDEGVYLVTVSLREQERNDGRREEDRRRREPEG